MLDVELFVFVEAFLLTYGTLTLDIPYHAMPYIKLPCVVY